MRQSEALRQAALELEHAAEFNETRTMTWSKERQRENNRRIAQSRVLHERADAAEREGR